MNRIQTIQQFLAKDGILKASFCTGILNNNTLVALCVWCMQNRQGSEVDEFVQAVDFPQFVADLVNGVFNATVDASIQQMEAYAELLRGSAIVCKALNKAK